MTKKKFLIILVSILASLALIATASFFIPRHIKSQKLRQALLDYYNNKVSQFTEENKTIKSGETEVVFLGDSLTDLYDLDKFYPDLKVLNRGIGGDTTYGLYDRLDVSAYEVEPKVIVMLIGVNNITTMLENYESIVEDIETHLPNTKLVLLSLTAMGDYWAANNRNQLAQSNNEQIKLIAQNHNCIYVDLFTPLLDSKTGEIHKEYTVDGGHFTDAGYQVITATIRPVLDTLLDKN